MRKSVAKAMANKRREMNPEDPRTIDRSAGKKARKMRKQAIEQDFGNLPIR